MTVVGSPGSHARSLRNEAWARMVSAALISTGAAISTLSNISLLQGGGTGAVVVACCAFVSVAAVGVFKDHHVKSIKASVGANAERRAGEAIERCGPTAVLHSVLLGAGGDADHVVLGPVAAVVETKFGAGEVSYRDGVMYAGRKKMFGNPVAQVNRQAKALKKEVGVFVEAVVCVVDMTNPPQQYGQVYVCSAADLPGVLAGLPHRFDVDVAQDWCDKLAPKCDPGAKTRTVEKRNGMSFDARRTETASPALGSSVTQTRRRSNRHRRSVHR